MSTDVLLYFAVAVMFSAALATGVYDEQETSTGIKKGVGVEGNPVVKFFARTDKPSFLQLFLVDNLVWNLPFALLGIFGGVVGIGIGLSFLTVISVKHVLAGDDWRNAIVTGKFPAEQTSAWHKFLGF